MEAVTVFCFLLCCVATGRSEDFNLLILHNNDMHARFEETESNSGTCMDKHRNKTCIGGFARTAHEVRKHRQQAKDGTGPPVLFLNAGDTFTGTTWFSVFTYNISAEFVNMLAPDVVTLGNHEFDNGVEDLALFLDKLKSPVVVTNLDFQNVPSLQNKTAKSVVIEISGRKIGIVGYLTPKTLNTSHPGETIFYDEIGALRQETKRLQDENVTIIIALGHSGYTIDQQVANEVELVDVVVGGHSHSLLSNGDPPSIETIAGPYPTVVTQASGKKVPVVQAYAFTKYFGQLHVSFDDNGDLTNFYGSSPLMMSSVSQEQDILDALEIYRPKVDALYNEIVGSTLVVLEGGRTCRFEECNFGNLLADAFVTYIAVKSSQVWTDTPIGLFHSGSIRDTIDPFENGNTVTKGQLISCLPYGNEVVSITLKGSDLVKVLEHSISNGGGAEFLQVSGLRIIYDKSKPTGSRVVSVRARCGNCTIPVYQSVDSNENYRVVTTSFITNGGDGYSVLNKTGFNIKIEGLNDLDTIRWYFQKYSPVYPSVEGRIKFVESKHTSGSIGSWVPFAMVCLNVVAVLFV